MYRKLMTNGTLALANFVGFIMLIVTAVSNEKDTIYNAVSDSFFSVSIATTKLGLAAVIIYTTSAFASLVMGIITLATINSARSRGLAIASGVIGILGSLIGINAIVSYLGAIEENKYRPSKNEIKVDPLP